MKACKDDVMDEKDAFFELLKHPLTLICLCFCSGCSPLSPDVSVSRMFTDIPRDRKLTFSGNLYKNDRLVTVQRCDGDFLTIDSAHRRLS